MTAAVLIFLAKKVPEEVYHRYVEVKSSANKLCSLDTT